MSFTEIMPVSKIRKNIDSLTKESRVYKFYVDADGLKYLDGVNPTIEAIADNGKKVSLVYIGKSKNLFERFEWHLGMINKSESSIYNGTLSTLRHSYMANHVNISCLSEQDILDKFMDKHTYTQYMPTRDYEEIEKKLIADNDVPLNIKENTHPFTKINSSRRVQMKNKYRKKFPITDKVQQIEKGRNMIEDTELRNFARKAEEEGIKSKSSFLRWFRDDKQLSASQDRLYDAWDERNESTHNN